MSDEEVPKRTRFLNLTLRLRPSYPNTEAATLDYRQVLGTKLSPSPGYLHDLTQPLKSPQCRHDSRFGIGRGARHAQQAADSPRYISSGRTPAGMKNMTRQSTDLLEADVLNHAPRRVAVFHCDPKARIRVRLHSRGPIERH